MTRETVKKKITISSFSFYLTATKMTREEAEKMTQYFPVLISLILWYSTVHLWKPNWYWNDSITRIFRTIFGDFVIDVMGYFLAFIFIVFVIELRKDAKQILSQEQKDEESSNKSGENTENKK